MKMGGWFLNRKFLFDIWKKEEKLFLNEILTYIKDIC